MEKTEKELNEIMENAYKTIIECYKKRCEKLETDIKELKKELANKNEKN